MPKKNPLIKAYNKTMVTVKFDKESFHNISTSTNIIKVKLWEKSYHENVFGRAKMNITEIR